MHTFQTPAPVRLRIEIPKGRIKVVAQETEVTSVELTALHGDAAAEAWIAAAEVAQNGDEIVVRIRKAGLGLFWGGGAIEARVHAPLGSAATLSTGSGAIETIGRLGEVSASSGSGAIRLDDSGEARARTGSGDIAIETCAGSVDVKTGSGRITVGKVGANALIITGSGHAELAEAMGDARLTTGSGDIEMARPATASRPSPPRAMSRFAAPTTAMCGPRPSPVRFSSACRAAPPLSWTSAP